MYTFKHEHKLRVGNVGLSGYENNGRFSSLKVKNALQKEVDMRRENRSGVITVSFFK